MVKIFTNLDELKESSEIIIYHHLGLGDHIVCNGLVNYISVQNQIYLPVKERNFKAINYLYKENKNINLFKIKNENEDIFNFAKLKKLDILKIGFDNLQDPFNVSFYKQLNLDYQISYEYFNLPIENDEERMQYEHLLSLYNTSVKEGYLFVHNESSEGSYKLKKLSKKKIIYPRKEEDIFQNIFLYRKLIENAKEIHCVNSSFLNLIDRLNIKGELFFHDIIKNRTIYLSEKWEKINYGNKYRNFIRGIIR